MSDIIETRILDSVGAFDLRAELVPDFDTDDERATYGLIITASRKGTDLGESSIWMTQETIIQGDGEDFAHGYGPGLIEEAVAEATTQLRKLIAEPG